MPTKILIADDEASLRLLVRATLQSDSYLIEEAVDGQDALDKITANKPDILILDVMMPAYSGFEICEKIKDNEKLQDIVVIILTAKGKQTDKDWAKSVGANYFFSKPFSPLELLDLVSQISAGIEKLKNPAS